MFILESLFAFTTKLYVRKSCEIITIFYIFIAGFMIIRYKITIKSDDLIYLFR